MAVAITCVPAAPESTDFCRITVTGADANDLTAYDADGYPSAPEIRYYLKFTLGGEELGRSYVFNVNSDGDHEFNNYIFPDTGSWTIGLHNAGTDAEVTTQGVTVS